MHDFLSRLEAAVANETFILLVLSKPRSKGDDLKKVSVRPLQIKGDVQYQLAFRKGDVETHENCSADEFPRRVESLLDQSLEHAHLYTAEADVSAEWQGRDRWKLRIKPPSKKPERAQDHNRQKQYLIPEGKPTPFLQEIGVMTASGQVKAAMQKKFRQINRFLELVNDVVQYLPKEGPLRVIDFGCGKSYLTFALHYLLTEIHQREVSILGLDRKSGVIRDCARIAEKLSCEGLTFQEAEISEFSPEGPVHLSVSLHACDTATDWAIAGGVKWKADVILAVPCCQHELFDKLNSPLLKLITEHGILKERLAALSTDALRAHLLRLWGYRTQVVEFIDLEHTPKNLLIRAVRSSDPLSQDGELWREYQAFKQLIGIEVWTLERLLQNG